MFERRQWLEEANIEAASDKKCLDCSGKLKATYYGFVCIECGSTYNAKMEHITLEEIM